jgi:hypothetical protein
MNDLQAFFERLASEMFIKTMAAPAFAKIVRLRNNL